MNPDFAAFFAEQDEHMRLARDALQQYLSQKLSTSNIVTTSPSTSLVPSSLQTEASSTTPEPHPDHMDVDLSDKSPRGKRKETSEFVEPNPSRSKRRRKTASGQEPPKPHLPTAFGQMSSSSPVACTSHSEEISPALIAEPPANSVTLYKRPSMSDAQRTPGIKLTPSSSIEEISKNSFDQGTKTAKTKQQTSNKTSGVRKQHATYQAAIRRPASASTPGDDNILPETSESPRRTTSSDLESDIARCIANHASKSRQPKVHKASALGNNSSAPSLDSVSVIQDSSSLQLSTPAIRKTAVSKPQNVVSKSTNAGKSAKNKKIKMSPAEWAVHLMEEQKRLDADPKTKKVTKFLTGKNIYFCGGDQDYALPRTQGNMEILVKFGANLQPHFDPNVVTHIVVRSTCSLGTLLSKCGLRRISDIPDHIPTLTWDWVSNCIGQAEKGPDRNVRLPSYDLYAAYHERFYAGLEGYTASGERIGQASASTKCPKNSRDAVHDSESEEEAESSEVFPSDMKDATSTSKLDVSESKFFEVSKDDPLAEFYDQARAEHENQWTRYGEAEDSESEDDQLETDTESDHKPAKPMKRGYACDNKGMQVRQVCPNQDVVDLLSELKELHAAKAGSDEYWRVFTYNRAISAIRAYPKRIKHANEILSLSGIGQKTAQKIMEILETGGLRRIQYETTDQVIVSRIFQGIYGVGKKISLQWYATGNRSLDDLRTGKYGCKLSNAQKIGLKYYDDINSRMPREEAKALFDLIKPIALSIDPNLFVEIMGSYRRGKADCGDIDIMITRCPDDGRTHAGVLGKLLKKLHEADIVTEDLALPDTRDLEAIYRGLCHLPQEGSRQRRIDFLTIPWKSRGAALLYYTGDDIFNRAMRLKARHMEYSLNQRGLWEGVVRDTSNRTKKLNTGTIKASETEEEIFKILNVPYQEPHERVRNFS
ncbi:DNA polymerase lambda [Desarmillaria tabescens]|uniref:DNA polymerase lambda n=1 Tax=Armillaria tabescens TaxID=1929756 RepID=A0AA39T652_ARMTA|nr:DNA polymerase lambda [Desarmillaria tabescens]KAK0467096.1 DNA polymerase lambda [Desarmillaria tabescens]